MSITRSDGSRPIPRGRKPRRAHHPRVRRRVRKHRENIMHQQLSASRRQFLGWSGAALLAAVGAGTLRAEDPADVPTVDQWIKKQAADAPLAMRFHGSTAEECRKWQG